jgi:hypothetical protein
MTLPIPLIDHVIVNARDALDDSAALWKRLGFQLTPRGHHTLGSSNNLAILGTDYIELLGVTRPGGRTDVMEWPAGLNGLVFKTTDSDGVYTTLSEAGVPILPPQAFSRPVDMGDRSGDAAFRTVRLEKDASPAGRMFFCHHLTPDLVWHDPWRRHPNGAVGLQGMLIAAEDPAAYAALFRLMFSEHAVRDTPDGFALAAGLATVEVATPDALAVRLGDAMPPMDGRAAIMAALIVRTASLKTTRAALQDGGLPVPAHDGPIVLPADLAGGLALIFVE